MEGGERGPCSVHHGRKMKGRLEGRTRERERCVWCLTLESVPSNGNVDMSIV